MQNALQNPHMTSVVVEEVGDGALSAPHVVSWLKTCPLLSTVLDTELPTYMLTEEKEKRQHKHKSNE